MFCLNVIDHVRLDFGQAARNYTVHADAAERLAGRSRRLRFTVLALLVMSVIASIAALFFPAHNFDVSAAIAAALALTAYAVYLAMSVEARVQAHRTCARRLWSVGEEYRALLSEIDDGMVDQPSLLRRRDALLAAMNAVYEEAFPVDENAFESVRLLGGDVVGDETIERLLPRSVHRKPSSDAA